MTFAMPAVPRLFNLPSALGASPVVKAFLLTALLSGCEAQTAANAPGPGADAGSAADAANAADAAPAAVAIGRCTYANPFSQGQECKLYSGAAWDVSTATADCAAPMAGVKGEFATASSCGTAPQLSQCVVGDAAAKGYLLISFGDSAEGCPLAKIGCEVFAKGAYKAGATCTGTAATPDGTTNPGDPTPAGPGKPSAGDGTVFVQPYQSCVAPKNGEAAGQGPNGQVCTQVAISGATEFGRRFADYGNCADVRTQRPYWPGPVAAETKPDDPRLKDAAYMAEVLWAKQQVEASGCVCCHAASLTPKGASNWDVEGKGIWLDHLRDSGIAVLAGLVSSEAFGAFPAKDNNGFDRTALGIPTTDVPRMQKLLMGEWKRRGLGEADVGKYYDFGGPLVDQAKFKPEACDQGIGNSADGKVSWGSSPARYVYVLQADSANPGVPPNLDQPAGALWFVDVPTAAKAMQSGIAYGKLSGDQRQRLPATGPAPALQKGKTYYLYALLDVGVPVERCLFTQP